MLLLVLLISCPALAIPHSAPRNPHSKVTVVVANRLVLSDLDNPALPTVYKMLHCGSIALVSPNCTGPKTEASVLLTANAGSPCRGSSYVREFYNADEMLPDGTKAGAAFTVRTGRPAPSGSAVWLSSGQALRDSAKLNPMPTKLGALGDALHAAGMKTGVVGNADMPPDVIDRSAAVLAMDSLGIVDVGGLPSNEFEATRLRSPPSRTGKADLLVVQFGASTVLDESKQHMSDAAYAARKAEMLLSLDGLLNKLNSGRDTQGATLILVSFSPPMGAAWDQLTPIIAFGKTPRGLLTSSSTRTPGLIAASDFAPTVIGLMDLPPSGDMIGRAASVVPGGRGVAKLNDMSTRVTANQRVLTPVAVFLVALGALSFTPAALIIVFGLKPSRRIVRLLKTGMVAGASTFAALLLAVFAPAGAAGYIAGTAVSIVLLTCVGLGLARPHPKERGKLVRALPVVLVYAATALIIVVDALTGCNLCKWCGPSSYQITGMRFYGVGNEYAGVLIAMAALTALFLHDRKWVLPVLGVATIVTLGSGRLGANYGGTAAAVVTFVLLWLAVSRGRFGARHVVLAFGLAIAVVFAFGVLDWAIAGTAGSHAARAAGMTKKLGGGYLGSLAVRKVLFNLGITFSAAGLHYALAFVPFLALWFWKVRDKANTLLKEDARILVGMKAVLIGAVAAFMLNDSGIIFAGIMIAITALVLLYSLLEKVASCPES